MAYDRQGWNQEWERQQGEYGQGGPGRFGQGGIRGREMEGPDYYGPGFRGGEGGISRRRGWSGYEGGYGGGFGTSGYGRSPQGRYSGRGPKGYHRTDERIQEEINEELTRSPDIDATEIEVKVQNGVVTLTGTVEYREMKRMAEDIAEDVSGVTDVENRLRVSPEFAGSQTETGPENREQSGRTGGSQSERSSTGGGKESPRESGRTVRV